MFLFKIPVNHTKTGCWNNPQKFVGQFIHPFVIRDVVKRHSSEHREEHHDEKEDNQGNAKIAFIGATKSLLLLNAVNSCSTEIILPSSNQVLKVCLIVQLEVNVLQFFNLFLIPFVAAFKILQLLDHLVDFIQPDGILLLCP